MLGHLWTRFAYWAALHNHLHPPAGASPVRTSFVEAGWLTQSHFVFWAGTPFLF